MTEIEPAGARAFWKALMDNATGLIRDARILLDAQSFGRARSLTVLAQEELGKALWLYESFSAAWSDGDQTPREVAKLTKHDRDHIEKYVTAGVYSYELAEFWGDYSRWNDVGSTEEEWAAYAERERREAKSAAREANRAKQAGFYVDIDRSSGDLLSPSMIEEGAIADDLRTAARVIEMLLISDHTRMKHHSTTPYDSTHDQQFRLLPISHPEDWAAASEEFRQR